MQSILQARYYNLGKENLEKYLVQAWSKVKSSGIKPPKVHGVGKGLEPRIQIKKQVIKLIMITKSKEVSQIKSRLGQGKAGLRHKIKTPIQTLINKPIVQAMEKQLKVSVPDIPKIQNKVLPIPNYTIPYISDPKMIQVLEQ